MKKRVNYDFERRKKEQERRAKKEAKRMRKREASADKSDGQDEPGVSVSDDRRDGTTGA